MPMIRGLWRSVEGRGSTVNYGYQRAGRWSLGGDRPREMSTTARIRAGWQQKHAFWHLDRAFIAAHILACCVCGESGPKSAGDVVGMSRVADQAAWFFPPGAGAQGAPIATDPASWRRTEAPAMSRASRERDWLCMRNAGACQPAPVTVSLEPPAESISGEVCNGSSLSGIPGCL